LAIRRFSSVCFGPGSVAFDAIEGSGKNGAGIVDSAPGCALRRQGSRLALQWGGSVPEFAGLPLEGQRSGSGIARKGFRSVPRSPPSPPSAVGVTALHLRRPETGQAWLPAVSPRFETVRVHGFLRPRVPVPQVTCRKEPLSRTRNPGGSERRREVLYRSAPLGCPEADFPTPLFFNRPVPRSRSRRLLHPIDISYIIFV